jgi:hypothetical protein
MERLGGVPLKFHPLIPRRNGMLILIAIARPGVIFDEYHSMGINIELFNHTGGDVTAAAAHRDFFDFGAFVRQIRNNHQQGLEMGDVAVFTLCQVDDAQPAAPGGQVESTAKSSPGKNIVMNQHGSSLARQR